MILAADASRVGTSPFSSPEDVWYRSTACVYATDVIYGTDVLSFKTDVRSCPCDNSHTVPGHHLGNASTSVLCSLPNNTDTLVLLGRDLHISALS